MKIVNKISELQSALADYRSNNQTIGFVPTMGNLHQGHLSLVDKAKEEADCVVVSIFVNPTQFGPNEDFDAYPRTFEADCDKLNEQGADIVFAPSVEEVYPDYINNPDRPNLTTVHVAELGNDHCGESRPTHFDGVTTVVCKLFNMVRPDLAVFGQKDFQQLTIIKRMVRDLNIPVTILGAPIVREPNGVAMSSRNGYLSPAELQQAAGLQQTLQWAKSQLENHLLNFDQVEQGALERLNERDLRVDYFNIANATTLQVAESSDKEIVILAAVFLGKVRLIDNLTLSLQ
ncbi:pantoate--beta-alanine ligase [Kangiella sediminilitoris]|uniref:Pantothenate synthetase n=1 Tax=Kangiella sediminilitoris TaxID=1144748 RepID=A0A1B3BDC7_9GAMM|nr:pantoate--beta-alanine ligase [Kangiella sediminilitoris]AOE50763.1 pantoate--beta-alanine ligase [Kangiella sediminilitoris]